MRVHRPRSFAAIVIAAIACSDPNAPAWESAGALDGSGPLHHVVGSGHVAQSAGLREFTFHALQQADGSATGSFKIVLPSGLFFEADVTCLSVSGSTGWVGGTIRATNAAALVVGSTSMFYAIDGGEGGSATDIVSNAAFNGPAGADLAFCANQPLALPPLTVVGGNVQVR